MVRPKTPQASQPHTTLAAYPRTADWPIEHCVHRCRGRKLPHSIDAGDPVQRGILGRGLCRLKDAHHTAEARKVQEMSMLSIEHVYGDAITTLIFNPKLQASE